MNIHSLEMKGKLILEQIYIRELWVEEDRGRLVYDKTLKQYWVGGIDCWVCLNIQDESIHPHHFVNLQASDFLCELNDVKIGLQSAITQLKNFDIWQDQLLNNQSIEYDYLWDDFDAEWLMMISGESYGRELEKTISQGDLILPLDSTSFGNITIHDALIDTEHHIYDTTSDIIPSTLGTIQSDLDYLFSHDINIHTGPVQELRDFKESSCDLPILNLFLGTLENNISLKCVDSTSIVFVHPSDISIERETFQDVLDMCGFDFLQCLPWVITNVLIVDDNEDYNEITNYYSTGYSYGDTRLLYDFNSMVLREWFQLGWKLIDGDCGDLTWLEQNKIYIVPITNTMFFLDCNNNLLKLFDKKRLI